MESLALLKKLVGTNSVYPNERELSDFLYGYLKGEGFRVEKQEVEGNRFNILAEKGKGKNAVLFLGHLDTVPPAASWSHDPFTPRQRGDSLTGLGSFDMKGGLVSLLKAAESVKKGRLKLLLCVDEENISKGAWAAVKNRREWFRGVELVISMEPPIYSDKSYGQDINVISVGRGGRVVMRIDVRGRSAHQARLSEGINAIEEAAKIAERIGEMGLSNHPKLGREEIFPRRISGESKGLSVPDTASIDLDMRLVPPSSAESARKRIEGFIMALKDKGVLNRETEVSVGLKKRETPYLQPFETDMSGRRVAEVLEIMEAEVGKPIVQYARSVSDENVLAEKLKVPVIRIGPKGGNAHAADEWVSIKSIGRLASLYQRIIESV